MNVSLLKQKLLLILPAILAAPLFLWGQTTKVLPFLVFQDQPFHYETTSVPNRPTLKQTVKNGSLTTTEVTGQNLYKYDYTPNEGFLGRDTFILEVWKSSAARETQVIVMHYVPSQVIAANDFASVGVDVRAAIPVLANDYSNRGANTLHIREIPLTNNGRVVLNDDRTQIEFIPNPGFVGIAHLNYVVCDDVGTCDNATVSINVGRNPTNKSDTLYITTKKNTPQPILMALDGFSLAKAPTGNVFPDESGAMVYEPLDGFTGKDIFTYTKGSVTKTIIVEVLNVKDPNTFAFDDYIFTTVGTAIGQNVLINDQGGLTLTGLTLVSQPKYGKAAVSSWQKGVINYTPNAGFSGVDQAQYRVRNNKGLYETATAYFVVSNQDPSAGKFRLTTPKNTPLVVGYNVPILNYNFSVDSRPRKGTADFYAGSKSLVINGQTVSGYNMIVYTPGKNAVGMDEFELKYCVTQNGFCIHEKRLKIEVEVVEVGSSDPQCIDDCIWAGDANYDGQVDMRDILPLGLCMGETGKARPQANLSQWYGQYGEDWDNRLQGNAGVDVKHVDADGNGIIGAQDTSVISKWYLRTHTITPEPADYLSNIPLYLRGPLEAEPGDLVEIDILVGTPQTPAIDVYGLTFTWPYDPTAIQPNSVDVQFLTDSWMAYSSPVLGMVKKPWEGRIDAGYSRTSGMAASGQGRVGKLRFVVDGDIVGVRKGEALQYVDINIPSPEIMTSAGLTAQLAGAEYKLRIVQKDENSALTPLSEDQLKVFPNPSSDYLQLHLNGGREYERVQLFNLSGQLMYDSGKVLERNRQIDVRSYSDGLYVLKAFTKDGVITKKFEVIR